MRIIWLFLLLIISWSGPVLAQTPSVYTTLPFAEYAQHRLTGKNYQHSVPQSAAQVAYDTVRAPISALAAASRALRLTVP